MGGEVRRCGLKKGPPKKTVALRVKVRWGEEKKTSLSVLLVFVPAFTAAVWVTVGVVVEVHFVHGLDRLGQIVLEGRDGRAQRRGPEAVRDEAEVGQTALDARFQDGLRPRVPQRRAVLG